MKTLAELRAEEKVCFIREMSDEEYAAFLTEVEEEREEAERAVVDSLLSDVEIDL